MHIDWITVAAQIVNFLVLVALLKRFLYGPIVRAMDEREGRIEARWKEAGEKIQSAEAELAGCQRERERLEAEREELLSGARAEAETFRQELIAEARAQVDAQRATWLGATERERDLFVRSLGELTARSACELSRRAVAELSGAALEELIVEKLSTELEKLDEDERAAFAEAVRASGQPVLVTSAVELPETLRQKVARLVQRHLPGPVELRFEASPELVCGLRLSAGGRRIGWNLDDYMVELEDGLVGALD